MPDRGALAELRRLVLAREDIKCSRAGCEMLEQGRHDHGMQWGLGTWALWTGIVVSYCRPFTTGKLQLTGAVWQTFQDANLQIRHDGLRTLRDGLFAHNDIRHEREVVVMPPGSWGPVGSATLETAIFDVSDATETRKLCEFQVERIDERIIELVEKVCEGRHFEEGAIVKLADLASWPRSSS